MPAELLVVLAVVVLTVIVGWIALRRATTHAVRGQAHPRGPMAAFGAMLDESVALYGIRRAFGRSTRTRADRAVARLQAETEAEDGTALDDAYAARLAAAAGRPVASRPTRLVVTGTAAAAPRPEDRGRQAHPLGGVAPLPTAPVVRTRLWRDSAIAVL